ncbi:MAG: four helix bundle protein [Chloroflexi bacterium]|nr:four helix bundle protein [Chloroflexota bacterium]
MAIGLEDLQVLKSAELVADSIWKQVVGWDDFAKDVVGKQITRAADSVGANISESFGRYNFGEKLQFLYYSRGSLFETKYWLNRAKERGLMKPDEILEYTDGLTVIARQLNSFASGMKNARTETKKSAVRETAPEYLAIPVEDVQSLFSPTLISIS